MREKQILGSPQAAGQALPLMLRERTMVSAAECPDFHVAAAFRAGRVREEVAFAAGIKPRAVLLVGAALGRGKEFPRPFYVVQDVLAVFHFRQQAAPADLRLSSI